jgi:hypothetical protein
MSFATRSRWGTVAVLGCLGLLAGRVPDAAAQPKPVVVVQSGEAATLDWHMHCDKNAHEPDRQIFDTHFLAVTIVRHRSAPYFEPGERASQRHDK